MRTARQVKRKCVTLSGYSDIVRGVAVTPDGRWAVSASKDRTLKVWDLKSGTDVRATVGPVRCRREASSSPAQHGSRYGVNSRNAPVATEPLAPAHGCRTGIVTVFACVVIV
jgi:WD40 repeat protein